jgi:hypothetical protein
VDRGTASGKLAGVLALMVVPLALLLPALLASPVRSGGAASGMVEAGDPAGQAELSSTSELTHHTYLPIVLVPSPSYRLGYCATDSPITRFPDISHLRAGWYVDFRVRMNPPRPLGMEYVQTVRLHQMTTCWPERTSDRQIYCPYTEPYTYTLTSPGSHADIVASAQMNPGSLWLIGNEMDRTDWSGGGQDEMLPELYAHAYHELYYLIRGIDPTARVAVGGIIQATPSRLEYMTKMWDEYTASYASPMPVDVWNVHNFIFKEACDSYGASVPPGYEGAPPYNDPCFGWIPSSDWTHVDMGIFDQQIRAFRQWMKDRGQQNKELIVSEYGILYYHEGMEGLDTVRGFMLDTFDYFMNTKDCSLGYVADDCRLVQRWAWYSLDDDRPSINQYAKLFDNDTLQMTDVGEAFAEAAPDYDDTW